MGFTSRGWYLSVPSHRIDISYFPVLIPYSASYFFVAWFMNNTLIEYSGHLKERTSGPWGVTQEREGFEIFRAIPNV
jgi:hypothetical protein